jgi:hypothetical protein
MTAVNRFAEVWDEFNARALLDSPQRQSYLADTGLLPVLKDIEYLNGPVVVSHIEWWDDGCSWEFSDPQNGFLACIIEARERVEGDEPEAIDFVAWPLDDPFRFREMFGNAECLGRENISNPATYAWGETLRLHRTPVAWLKGQCRGAVVLYEYAIGRILKHALGNIACEDKEHALSVGRRICTRANPFLSPDRIGFMRGVAA